MTINLIMTMNWSDIASIIVLTIMAIVIRFSYKKSVPEKMSEEERKNLIKKPGTYFFTTFAMGYFAVSILIDIIAIITHSFKIPISYKYLLPLFFAYISYLRLKNASKF